MAIRGEGTSDDYLPPEVPTMPSFKLHKFVSSKVVETKMDYRTGVIYTTNRCVWGHDNQFKRRRDRQDKVPDLGRVLDATALPEKEHAL